MSETREADSAVASLPPTRRRRGGVALYGLWQLRDFFVERGLPMFIIAGLLGYLTAAPMLPALHRNIASLPPRLVAKWGGADAATAVLMKDFNTLFLRNFLGAVVFLGALLAMNGIVANDRKQGHYRFLFTKPVAPWRYYGQAFLIHWAGYLSIMTLLALLYGFLIWPVLSVPLVVVLALMFLTYAGITFALSAAARWDWLSLVTVAVAASFLWDRFKDSTSAAAALLYLLPPLHRTSDVYLALAKGDPVPWPLVEWFVGYGVACYLVGLIVLRYRRLAIV